MADRFGAHAEELGTLVTRENGKKIAEGLFEGASPSPTAASFRKDGSWTVQTRAGAEPFQV